MLRIPKKRESSENYEYTTNLEWTNDGNQAFDGETENKQRFKDGSVLHQVQAAKIEPTSTITNTVENLRNKPN